MAQEECIAFDLYTTTQENVLAWMPYFTAPLSFMGSSLIIWAIAYERQNLLKTVYHRLVFAMSILDWLNSFGMIFLGPWTVPSDYAYGRSGAGTTNTCTVAGVFLNLMFGTLWYSAFLAVSFVMTIRWEWKERRIACCMEPFAHFFGFFGPVFSSILAAKAGSINPVWSLPGWCWYSDNPPFCAEGNIYCFDGEIVPSGCTRGEDYQDDSGAISIGLFIFLWLIVVVCMTAIVLKVLKTEKSLQQYAIGDERASLVRTKETAVQCLLYIGAFLATFAPISILMLLAEDASNPLEKQVAVFVFAFITKTITPLIGFFNSWIYFRKRYKSLLKDGQSLAFLRKIPLVSAFLLDSHNRPESNRAQTHVSNSVSHVSDAMRRSDNQQPTQPPEETGGQEMGPVNEE